MKIEFNPELPIAKIERAKVNKPSQSNCFSNSSSCFKWIYQLFNFLINFPEKFNHSIEHLPHPEKKLASLHQIILPIEKEDPQVKIQETIEIKLTESLIKEGLENSVENRAKFFEKVQQIVLLEAEGSPLEQAQVELSEAMQEAKIEELTNREILIWLQDAKVVNNQVNRAQIYDQVKEIVSLRYEKHGNRQLRKDSSHRLARKVAKAKLSVKLNPKCLVPIGVGLNGSVWVNSLKGKHLGVFKPNREAPRGLWYDITTRFRQGHYLLQGKAAEAATERAAYLLAKELKLDRLNIAPVQILSLAKQKGAFLVFEKGEMVEKHLNELNNKENYSQEELELFQFFVIFDYLLGNLDRKEENWLIVWKNKKLKKIAPIDNANSFPFKKPNRLNVLAAQNLYHWKKLKLAQVPFTPSMLNYIRENITDENIQSIIETINSDPEIQGCLPHGRKFLWGNSRAYFELRALSLRTLAEEKKPTPFMLTPN